VNDRDLLRRHIEAVWDLTLPPLDEPLHELVLTQSIPPWSLYLASFAQEQIAFWHPDVTPEQRLPLLARARQAGVVWEEALGMHREVAFHYPVISPEQQAQAEQSARILTPDDTDLINTFEAGSAPIFLKARNAPCIGTLVDGRVVSIAHSSRQTPAACELGVDTLPEARRQGYAATATTLWTAIVQQKGLVPIYSASAGNAASLHLAQSVGYVLRIEGTYGPLPENSH
jgi:RimJ/RimL family protein N-acetyltransferase